MSWAFSIPMATKRPSQSLRRAVAERAHYCCEYCYCQQQYGPTSFEVEHVTPIRLGGQTVMDNLAFACRGCNAAKGGQVSGMDPVTQSAASLFHPRQHRWEEHFVWSSDYTRMIGLTATGRATVATLQLNRSGVMSLRHILYEIEQHPPV